MDILAQNEGTVEKCKKKLSLNNKWLYVANE